MKFKPVIFGGYVNGYSLARTFKETYGIDSLICDHLINISSYSIFCEYQLVTNPQLNEQKFVEDVKCVGTSIRNNNQIPLLIVTNDIWLIPLSKYKKELEEIFLYSFSDAKIINELANKKILYEICEKINISYPKTYKYNGSNKNFYNLLPPVLIKPSNVPKFISFFPDKKRNGVFETLEEAQNYLNELYSRGYQDDMIIQEYIPGGVENLYTCTTYSTRMGIVKGVSVGCKLSQYPPEAGTITSGLVKYNQEVEDLTKKILEQNQFFGIANTEFKYDARDKTFKMIEVNARPGMWNYSSILSGVNLVEKMVDDIIFNKEVTFSRGTKNIVWTRISKKELINCTFHTDNAGIIKDLINRREVYDPLVGCKERLNFRTRVRIMDFKFWLITLYRKFF